MRAAPKQDIDIHMPRGDQQRVRITRRDDGVSVGQPDAEGAVGDDFGDGEGGGGAGGVAGGGVVGGGIGSGGGGGRRAG